MRTSFLCSLSLVMVVSSCGRDELIDPTPAAVAPEPEPSPVVVPARAPEPEPSRVLAPTTGTRVRLNSNFQSSDGFRFSDGAVLTTTTINGGRCLVTEVRDANGALVYGGDARVDVQSYSGRYLTLLAPGGSVCVINHYVPSLAEVDASDCGEWKPLELLHLSFQFRENAFGTGLVVRTEPGRAYRMWIAESGFDQTRGADYAILDFDKQSGPATCSIEQEACAERDDCCNSRHSCVAGRCTY